MNQGLLLVIMYLNNTEHYLNCHIYPNNVPGTGVIEMEITTNSTNKDTLVFQGTAIDNLSLNELNDRTLQSILTIYNLEGKILANPIKNQIILIEYENGSIEKTIFLE